MKYKHELSYSRPIALVMKMITDRSYFESKYQAMEVVDFAVFAHEASADRFTIGCRYGAAGQTRIPEFARKFVGDSIRVRQTDTWQIPQRVGTIDIEIAGAPVAVHADMRLEARGAKACAILLDWTVRCGIPLIGGKVEKLIAEDVQRRTETDGKVSCTILERYE